MPVVANSRPGRPPQPRYRPEVESRRCSLSDILVVCTANVARSPLLAALLQSGVDARLGRGFVTVESAGVEARFGAPAHEAARRHAADYGVALEGHRSRPLAYAEPATAGLVIAMTRAHVRSLRRRYPQLHPRTFRVRELVRALEAVGSQGGALQRLARQPWRHETLAEVVALADAARPRRARSRRLDIADPIGRGEAYVAAMAEEFERSARLICDAVCGPLWR